MTMVLKTTTMVMEDRAGGTATKDEKENACVRKADPQSGSRRIIIVPVMEAAVDAEWSVRLSVCLWHLLAKAD